ncbi:uncharacterized protein B0H18DRAFT_1106289 [Fomitopsis serialis]|uniref:uncharacterized protein n=1 Tax=Fomitopsis serialis TaxID=139415 RepID=UPI0020080B72|nr:uncharacterized protein B0H18DRAFT_1106289 [Neoantrodia serialis]KAH9920290.1 hypothetical protein B0H18DRAFT_1106289 [Neoantrodia serialis]
MTTQVIRAVYDYVLATRYLSGAAITCSLYDHALCIGAEIRVFWQQKRSFLPILVVLSTYLMEASTIVIAYTTVGAPQFLVSPQLLAIYGRLLEPSRELKSSEKSPCRLAMLNGADNPRCEALIIVIGVSTTMVAGCQELVLFLRVHTIWDNRKEVKYALLFGFVVCYGVSIAFALVTMLDLAGKLQYNGQLKSCTLPEKPKYMPGVWGAMIAYDIYVFALIVLNALNQPRKRNIEILDNLRRDGLMVLTAIFFLRISKLSVSIVGNASETFLLPVISWAFETRMMYRLFLKVREAELSLPHGWKPVMNHRSVFVSEEVEMIYI